MSVMLVVIGNSPSSGSTFLGDLLDSTSYSACGPELGLFSNFNLYDYQNYLMKPTSFSPISSFYLNKSYLDKSALPFYGLTEEKFRQLLLNSDSLSKAVDKMKDYFLSFRGKRSQGIWFEKTPQNISCIDSIISNLPNSKFIHIVRDPRHVFSSLIKRGFSPYKAAATWLIDVAKYLKYQSHPNVLQISYEDLVNNSYEISSGLINTILGQTVVTSEDVETGYKNNHYRRVAEHKISTWGDQSHEKVINANDKPLAQKDMAYLASFLSMKISSGYARLYDLPELSLSEAMCALGYDEIVEELKVVTPIIQNRSLLDRLGVYKKFLFDLYRGKSKLHDVACYIHPLEEL